MKKSFIILLAVVVVIMVAAVGVYSYVFQEQKNTFDLKAEYSIKAEDLFKQFEMNEQSASAKYIDKILEVDGKILAIKEIAGNYQFSFVDENFGVTCFVDSNYAVQQKKEILNLKIGDEVKIKGKCNGYLSDVKLDRCVIVKVK